MTKVQVGLQRDFICTKLTKMTIYEVLAAAAATMFTLTLTLTLTLTYCANFFLKTKIDEQSFETIF
jgi:hypothetical protein